MPDLGGERDHQHADDNHQRMQRMTFGDLPHRRDSLAHGTGSSV